MKVDLERRCKVCSIILSAPSFKRRVVGALKAGGESAIEELLDNPYINVSKAVIKGWLQPE